MTPQIIVIAFVFISLGITLAKHGQEQGKHNFFISLVGAAIWLSLLWWGGFFGCFFRQ